MILTPAAAPAQRSGSHFVKFGDTLAVTSVVGTLGKFIFLESLSIVTFKVF